MACGSCGQRRELAEQAAATATAPSGRKATYTVIEPSGATKSFDNYLDATTHRRQTNGTLTTST